jgi:transcriptional regulator with XRE-family HTH domain
MSTSSKNFSVALGHAIRERRQALGMSQEQLSAEAGLHRTYISDVERGARNVSIHTLRKLAFALQVSASSLLAGAELCI